MELNRIAGGDCGRDDCPTVFVTDRGTVAVQGYVVDRATPDDEAIVEIPVTILRDAARALGV
ncbi:MULTISPECIES: hypothetical protein [unclassified Pseudonocardia]|uniref:hypothetical protein n=1 Tax=unclassified Pseudonocardia TaxID=2619320 RepID=UPI00094AC7D7|nr:hypothetical protein [Pseudonocardia sp. Ae707_Ps1]